MPVIRITDATWDRLKRWAIPLEDTPEDAVRKVIDAAEEHLKCRPGMISTGAKKEIKLKISDKGKLRKGMKIPQKSYRIPILETLYELGGSASMRDVLNVVEQKMKGLLSDVDYQKVPSGTDVRWRNTAAWERFELVKDGLLKANSPSGVWELTSKGEQEIKSR